MANSLTKHGKRANHHFYNTCEHHTYAVDAHCRLFEVLDKGKAASLTAIVYTTDKHTGQVIFENQTTLVMRGSGGFGGKRIGNGKLITNRRFGVVLRTLFMVRSGSGICGKHPS